MRVDMSPEAITKRLKIVNELRRTCLSLANSSAGKSIQKKIFSQQVGAADLACARPLTFAVGQ